MEQRKAWDPTMWKTDPVRYAREKRQAQPEMTLKHRITASINLLRKNGYDVRKIDESEGKQS